MHLDPCQPDDKQETRALISTFLFSQGRYEVACNELLPGNYQDNETLPQSHSTVKWQIGG